MNPPNIFLVGSINSHFVRLRFTGLVHLIQVVAAVTAAGGYGIEVSWSQCLLDLPGSGMRGVPPKERGRVPEGAVAEASVSALVGARLCSR